jgi:dihydroorotate dehydrogenase electron transfer subunit
MQGSPGRAGGITAGRIPSPYVLTDVRVESERTRTFTLDATVEAEPGQFGMLWLPGLDEKPFSLRSAHPLSFTIAAVGPFSRALHRLRPGEKVWFRGPFGQGFRLTGTDHLLVGGGYGVAPMRMLAEAAVKAHERVRVVIGARTADEVLLLDDFTSLGIAPIVTTEDGSLGSTGRVTDAVGPLLATDPPATLYACGPHGMLAALERQAEAAALPAQLSWEAYMRCAVGICGSCEHQGLLLCADGPVLPPPGLASLDHPPPRSG